MKENGKGLVWFDQVDKNDLPLVGGKGANLGELTRAAIPVPPGFIVTTESYYRFMEEAGLRDRIEEILRPLDPEDSDRLNEVSNEIKELIVGAAMPPHIADSIREAYSELGGFVAVRSSATAEDLPEASFAGQQSTFLNIHGEDEVVLAVQQCWASLFEARAIFYRVEQGLNHMSVGIAVPVQRMVQSEVSGVMFTVDPLSNARDRITIEAIYGLGEAIVSGEVTPDHYLVQKDGFAILEKQIAQQEWWLARSTDGVGNPGEPNARLDVSVELQDKQKLSDEDIVTLARLGVKIEEHYQFPQDIEWAQEDGGLYIVQTRPVTTLGIAGEEKHEQELQLEEATILVSGSPASPGLGSGPVRIVTDPLGISEVKEGDLLVAEMTTPDFVPAMKRAAGIVTDRGGRTCHAAIVSRELGVPCVVGTGSGTKSLSPDRVVTVDGSRGNVYDGRVIAEEVAAPVPVARGTLKTRTKLYVNLAEPELAEKIAALDVDGVGLLRAEFMVAEIGEHPRYMLKEGRGEEFTSRLAEGLATFARSFDPRPVVYRTTDFKTNEYRHLKGGEEYEEREENPMIGYRGVARYVREPDVFKLEVDAVKMVRQDYKNLWVMIPFVRTLSGLARVKQALASHGLRRSRDFKLWMMVEVPSNVLLIDKFIDIGIDGVSIGSNDLTQLILGVDRDNEDLAEAFDERNEAVLLALERVIKASVARGVTCSICGQAPSVFPELTEKLVEWGITSVSVNRDVIDSTREIIAAAEQKQSEATS